MTKNTICLWFNHNAEEAAQFYAATFPDSRVGAVHRAPADFPGGKQGDALVVEFTVAGIPCIGLNGGPAFPHTVAFSFQIATDDQAETDGYWNAIVGNGGRESECGWCQDKWGLSWQITPRALTEAMAKGGDIAKRHAGLLPDDANGRARAVAWTFAALDTVEPPIWDFAIAKIIDGDKVWFKEHRSILEVRVSARLGELSNRLGDADWLGGAFNAGDRLMVTVLRRFNGSNLLDEYPNLSAFVARGETRPAFKRAFDAQLAVFTGRPPGG